MTGDCFALFIKERKRLRNAFRALFSFVCLTSDTWTSGQNLSDMCLTMHFIDDSWRLHKRILNFCPVTCHFSKLISRSIEKYLLDWRIKRVMILTVDNVSSNELVVSYLRKRVNN